MKTYKGFNNDLTCRGFKFEEGKTYEEADAKLCKSGFHACESPVMCFGHYSPGTSVYHVVELEDVAPEREDDTKRVGRKITIGRKLSVPEICKLTTEYVRAHCSHEHNAEQGKPATAGDSGAATAGYRGAATAGDRGAATSRGSSASGKNGLAVARGSDVRVKGGLGAILVIVEENENNYGIKKWKAVEVDGEKVKADTWYQLVNGEMVECE